MAKKKGKGKKKVSIPKGDPGVGQKIFNAQCGVCHALSGDDKNAAAPTLESVVGKKAGVGNFPYSNAMKKSKVVWTPANIFEYLKMPSKFIPGNRMSFAGISDAQERADLIAFLEEC